MDTLLVIGATAIIVLMTIMLVIRLRRQADNNEKDAFSTVKSSLKTSEEFVLDRAQRNGITLPIERLLATTEIAETSLFEITDHTVIARISQTIPAAANIVSKTIANKALQSVELYNAY